MKQKIIINKREDVIRIALLEKQAPLEIIVEATAKETIQGHVYKGKIAAIVPGLDSAFVDIGLGRNAFLHSSDVIYPFPDLNLPASKQKENEKDTGKRKRFRRKPKIKSIFKVGQEIAVQLIKEPDPKKGPRVTTNISLPGRFLVYLPFSTKDTGISRKIESRSERKRLKDTLKSCTRNDTKFIVRTAAAKIEKQDIRSDVKLLSYQWNNIRRKFKTGKSPKLIHSDLGIIEQIIRDIYNSDIEEIIVDDYQESIKIRRLLKKMSTSYNAKVTYHKGTDIFEKFEIEKKLHKALSRHMWLKSGGHIIIDQTEALTTIDVNTGKFVGKGDNQATIVKTNMEACAQIARQLRLRNIGGIIVIDFIDMRAKSDRDKVLNELKNKLKKDRSKTKVYSFSELGIVQMTRQRVRKSLRDIIARSCPYCNGNGVVLNELTVWQDMQFEIKKKLQEHQESEKEGTMEIYIHPELFNSVSEKILCFLSEMKKQFNIKLLFKIDENLHLERFRYNFIPVNNG